LLAAAGVPILPMMKISRFLVLDESGLQMQAAVFGNNVAFSCTQCEHPVLER
jgi:hypothetical protein